MPAFEYDALNSLGRHKRGVSEADTPRQIRQQLRREGLTPISVEPIEKKSISKTSASWKHRPRVPTSEISLLTRQLATLVRAGLPLDDSLQALSEQVEHAEAKKLVLSIRSRVMEGYSLSEAMTPFSNSFSDLYIATVSAGEHSRDLAYVLEQLADYNERKTALTQKIRLAMLYPSVLAATALLVTAGLLIYVVPEVVAVFEGTDKELPFITIVLISVSDFLAAWWLVIILFITMLTMSVVWIYQKDSVKYRCHDFFLKLPIIKNLIRQADAARFTRTLGILLASGVSMIEALAIGQRALICLPIRKAVEQSQKKVGEGETLHTALKHNQSLPPLTIHLIANGEASGNLESMLESAAEAHERNLQTQISTFLGLLEPALILMMGGIVLTIVIAILLPIFELNQLV